jgi:hypothetical protein
MAPAVGFEPTTKREARCAAHAEKVGYVGNDVTVGVDQRDRGPVLACTTPVRPMRVKDVAIRLAKAQA